MKNRPTLVLFCLAWSFAWGRQTNWSLRDLSPQWNSQTFDDRKTTGDGKICFGREETEQPAGSSTVRPP